MSFISVLRPLALVTVLAACASAVDSSPGPARAGPEAELRRAIDRARAASAQVELVVRADVDGVTEAEITTVGTITDGGHAFDVEIFGPISFGLPLEAGTVGARLVGDRFFQRSPLIAEVVPGAGDRWVEVGAAEAASSAFGLVGPTGFVALDLVDDVEAVSSPSPGRYEGSLGEVVVEGGRIESVDGASFDAVVTGDVLTSLTVTLTSGTGVELAVELQLSSVGEVAPIAMPDPADVFTP